MFPLRQLAILGTFVASPGDARDLMDLVRAGKVRPIPVDLRPLDEANSALEDLRAPLAQLQADAGRLWRCKLLGFLAEWKADHIQHRGGHRLAVRV